MRLTKKYDDGSYGIEKCTNKHEIKLGQLEDIEDELGIDLITLFKVINGGKVYNKKYGYYNSCSVDTHDKTIYFENYETTERKPLDALKLQDYGKTWALTKEELL